jgi:hypothetical protein
MAGERRHGGARFGVPKPSGLVERCGHDAAAIRAESRAHDRAGVARQGRAQGAGRRVPDARGAIFGCRDDASAVRAELRAPDPAGMARQHDNLGARFGRPQPMLRHFFEMFVDEHTIMLDPTCGSGTALRAAEALKAKYVLGVEIKGRASLVGGATVRALAGPSLGGSLIAD